MELLREKHITRLSRLRTSFTNSLMAKIPWNDRLIGLIGSRGVGKTTLMLQYIKNQYGFGERALYVTMDDISNPFNSLLELVDEFVKHGGEHLFIDEIHKYPNWSTELKNIYDLYFDLKIVFSGSSILEMEKGKADLSRRALMFKMNGLSYRQFLELENNIELPVFSLSEIMSNHSEIALELSKKIKPLILFGKYLQNGYYPFYIQNEEYYSMRLLAAINQIIDVDIPTMIKFDFVSINKLKLFLKIIAQNVPYKPNISKLSAALGVSWQTTIHYIDILEQAQLISKVLPFGKSISALSKPEKILLEHPNHYNLFNTDKNLGSIRESFFVNQVKSNHEIEIPTKGDFIVDKVYMFEIGGKNKTYHQIANEKNSFIVSDNIEFGYKHKIPLWLFGFLY